MCFSTTVSFSTSAALIPIGIYAFNKVMEIDPRYLPLALIPFMFGVQQFIEGFVWHYYDTGDFKLMQTYGRGFIFFSHFFWMLWIPLTSWLIEPQPQRKNIFFTLMAIGFTLGIITIFPLLSQPGRLDISVIEHSISYETHLVTHEYITKNMLRVGYAIIVLAPLLLSSVKILQNYGLLVSISVLVTYIFFEYAYVSVWCFFAAFLSFYILYHVLHPATLEVIRNGNSQ